MRDKIVNRDAGGANLMDTALIGSSSLPVWKMLAVSSSIPGGDRITEDYAQLIAVDVAYAYFTNLSKTLRNALQNETGKGGPDAVDGFGKDSRPPERSRAGGAGHAARRVSERACRSPN